MARTRLHLGLGLVALAATAVLAQGMDYDFMPPGGRTILIGILGEEGTDLPDVATREASVEEWQIWAKERDPAIDETALATFAGYAELNFPLDAKQILAAEAGDLSALPPDGKDLAIAQCQYCHSLFSGYLMHRRDETGWRGTFKAPFHAEIPMTELERDTFARYSALNMPLRFEDVPPELRF